MSESKRVHFSNSSLRFQTPCFWRYDWTQKKTYRSKTVHLRRYDWKTRPFGQIAKTQEVQADQTNSPLVGSGIIHKDPPKDQPLCLVGCTSKEKNSYFNHPPGSPKNPVVLWKLLERSPCPIGPQHSLSIHFGGWRVDGGFGRFLLERTFLL